MTVTASRECPVCPGTGKIICYSSSPLLFFMFRSSLSCSIAFCISNRGRLVLPKPCRRRDYYTLTCTTDWNYTRNARENSGRWSTGWAARLSSLNEARRVPRGVCGKGIRLEIGGMLPPHGELLRLSLSDGCTCTRRTTTRLYLVWAAPCGVCTTPFSRSYHEYRRWIQLPRDRKGPMASSHR